MLATARAVEHAHSRGVLHRDIKPSNILIDALDQPQVADFGLARSQHEAGMSLGAGKLSARLLSWLRELASGGKNGTSPGADLYALGAALYQCLTGRPPFQGESILQILDQARPTAPTLSRRLVPNIPLDLATGNQEAICQI